MATPIADVAAPKPAQPVSDTPTADAAVSTAMADAQAILDASAAKTADLYAQRAAAQAALIAINQQIAAAEGPDVAKARRIQAALANAGRPGPGGRF